MGRYDLRVKDLKQRYSINIIHLDSFSEITDILYTLQRRVIRRNIFISGAIDDFSRFGGQENINLFLENLSQKLVSNDFKVVTGFGKGVGVSILNGVLQYVFKEKGRKIEDAVLLRPFPYNVLDPTEQKKIWSKYRKELISNAGIVIFLFGNKMALLHGC